MGETTTARKEEIILGACDVFMYEFNGTAIPSDAEIETDAHCVGHTSGGASVEYKPTKYDVTNSYGKTVRSFITKEEITVKTGLLSWRLENVALLSSAKITQPEANDEAPIKKLTFGGGDDSKLNTVLVRFRHLKKDTGKYLRFTCVAQGGNGFTMAFSDTEMSIDAELGAIEYIKDFFAEFKEELTAEEVAQLVADGAITAASSSSV